MITINNLPARAFDFETTLVDAGEPVVPPKTGNGWMLVGITAVAANHHGTLERFAMAVVLWAKPKVT